MIETYIQFGTQWNGGARVRASQGRTEGAGFVGLTTNELFSAPNSLLSPESLAATKMAAECYIM